MIDWAKVVCKFCKMRFSPKPPGRGKVKSLLRCVIIAERRRACWGKSAIVRESDGEKTVMD